MLQGMPPISLLQQDPGAVQEPHREHSLFIHPWQCPFPQGRPEAGPCHSWSETQRCRGRGSPGPPTPGLQGSTLSPAQVCGTDCVPPERPWQGHTTPDLVTPFLTFQHTIFKHEPGLLLGKHRAEKSRSWGKMILNSRAHLKPTHIISLTILSFIYEENKTNITHIYFSLISQPQSPPSVCKAAVRETTPRTLLPGFLHECSSLWEEGQQAERRVEMGEHSRADGKKKER